MVHFQNISWCKIFLILALFLCKEGIFQHFEVYRCRYLERTYKIWIVLSFKKWVYFLIFSDYSQSKIDHASLTRFTYIDDNERIEWPFGAPFSTPLCIYTPAVKVCHSSHKREGRFPNSLPLSLNHVTLLWPMAHEQMWCRRDLKCHPLWLCNPREKSFATEISLCSESWLIHGREGNDENNPSTHFYL